MLPISLTRSRAISGTVISASGSSSGVPGTVFRRGSRWAWFVRTGSRCSAAQPGTPDDEPEALITVPVIARDLVKGMLNIYRLGEDASFSDDEFELAPRVADAAPLALDNAQIDRKSTRLNSSHRT